MCCHQVQSFWLKYAPNCSATAASPQTLLRELTALLKPLAGKGEGKGGEGEERGRKGTGRGKGREARGGCLLLSLSLAMRHWFACNVCQFIVTGAGPF